MKTIYKYHLEVTDVQEVEMPYGSKILKVEVQDGTPCIWVMVLTDAPPERRKIRIYGTGHEVKSIPIEYVGTFFLNDGRLVFHVFEEGN